MYVFAPFIVTVVDCPTHTESGLLSADMEILLETVIVTVAVSAQVPVEPTTVYVVEFKGVAVVEDPVDVLKLADGNQL